MRLKKHTIPQPMPTAMPNPHVFVPADCPRPAAVFWCAVCLVLTGASCQTGRLADGDDGRLGALVEAVASPDTSYAERRVAARQLESMPPQTVLPALLPRLRAPKPGMRRWDYAARPGDDDDEAPAPWQAWFAGLRAWEAEERALAPQAAGRLLLNALPRVQDPFVRATLVEHLQDYWTPQAEGPLLDLVRDRSAPFDVRFAAALTLGAHTGERHGADIAGFIEKNLADADRMFRYTFAANVRPAPKDWLTSMAARGTTQPANK